MHQPDYIGFGNVSLQTELPQLFYSSSSLESSPVHASLTSISYPPTTTETAPAEVSTKPHPTSRGSHGKKWTFSKIVRKEDSAKVNRFIFDRKKTGMKFGQIKDAVREQFGYDLKEPTLRTRYRTIDKPPGERIRKPNWQTNDVRSRLD
jgi:hypothetical protein